MVLGPNSIVLQECNVGTSQVPHGMFDLVAGVTKVEPAFTVGVTVDREDILLQNPMGIEAKTDKPYE